MELSTFIFLLTVWTDDAPAVYAEDVGLTATDCMDRMVNYSAESPTWERGISSCEIDTGHLEESNSVAYTVEIAKKNACFVSMPI